MESSNNVDGFIKSLVKYEVISVGLSFQGKEINYPGYIRQKAHMDVRKKRSGIFSGDYKIEFFNKNTVYFDTSNEILQVDGVIFSCNGYEILSDISTKELKNVYVCFEEEKLNGSSYLMA